MTRTNSVLQPKHEGIYPKGIYYEGIFKSKSEWARDIGISTATLVYRIKNFPSLGDALTRPVSTHNRPINPTNKRKEDDMTNQQTRYGMKSILTYKSEANTVEGWAEVYDMNPYSLLYRVNAGWSNHKALNTPIRGSKETIIDPIPHPTEKPTGTNHKANDAFSLALVAVAVSVGALCLTALNMAS